MSRFSFEPAKKPKSYLIPHKGQQTFYFNSMSQPPYFLHSVLPSRLAQIRHIQFCYNQLDRVSPCRSGTAAARREHRLQQCAFCNTNLWLDLVKKLMTGLKTVELLMYLYSGTTTRLPTLGDPWIVRLFSLQVGGNGLRGLTIRVYRREVREWGDTNVVSTAQLDRCLQDKIRGGVERYSLGRVSW